MHLKAMVIGGLTALLTAVFLQLLFPLILGFLLAVVISGATFLDPLYADDRLDTIWGTFGQVVALQVGQTLITAVLAGIIAGEVAVRWQSCSAYFIAGSISAVIHIVFLSIFGLMLPLFMDGENLGVAQTFAMMLALIMGFLIGAMSAVTASKWGSKISNVQKEQAA